MERSEIRDCPVSAARLFPGFAGAPPGLQLSRAVPEGQLDLVI